MSNQSQRRDTEQLSPLLSLPAELRNTIYTFALTGPKPLKAIDSTPEERADHVRRRNVLHLCRQIRSETQLLYYNANTFVLDFTKAEILTGVPKVAPWLQDIGGPETMRTLGGPTISGPGFKLDLVQNTNPTPAIAGLEVSSLHLDDPPLIRSRSSIVGMNLRYRYAPSAKTWLRASVSHALAQPAAWIRP
jgi:hypothetical protein